MYPLLTNTVRIRANLLQRFVQNVCYYRLYSGIIVGVGIDPRPSLQGSFEHSIM